MTTTTTQAGNKDVAEIFAIAKLQLPHAPDAIDLAMRAVEDGKTLPEFREIMLDALTREQAKKGGAGTWSQSANTVDVQNADVRQILRTPQDFQRHYATRDQGPAIPLIDFVRGVAGMKTTKDATRALSVGTDTAGGYAVPLATMPGILGALAPASSLMMAGVGIIPLNDGAKSYAFAAVDTIPTAAWRSEAGAVAESDATFRNVVITPRSLSFRFKVSRELLADAGNISVALDTVIAQSFAKEIDRTGLRGTGTAPEPRGLKNTSGIQTVTNGTNGAALASYANFFSAISAILNNDAPMPNGAIMSPRDLVKLAGLLDTTNQPIMVPKMIEPIKQVATSQIPTNLTVGSSTDCSEIYVGDFSKMFFGLREALSIQMLNELYATTGEIGFVCHSRIDVAVLYPKAFALITGVRA